MYDGLLYLEYLEYFPTLKTNSEGGHAFLFVLFFNHKGSLERGVSVGPLKSSSRSSRLIPGVPRFVRPRNRF